MLKWFDLNDADFDLFTKLLKHNSYRHPVFIVLGGISADDSRDIAQYKYLEQTSLLEAMLYCEEAFPNLYGSKVDTYYSCNYFNDDDDDDDDEKERYYDVVYRSDYGKSNNRRHFKSLFLYIFDWQPDDSNDNNNDNNKKHNEYHCEQYNKQHSKEVNTMANVNETFKTVMSMKMLNSIMRDGSNGQDLGKLFLMQQMMNGEPLQVTDVIKSKLIKQFELSEDGDLPLEKVMLLQMLDGGQVDMNQLIMLKMMGTLFDDVNSNDCDDSCSNKKHTTKSE